MTPATSRQAEFATRAQQGAAKRWRTRALFGVAALLLAGASLVGVPSAVSVPGLAARMAPRDAASSGGIESMAPRASGAQPGVKRLDSAKPWSGLVLLLLGVSAAAAGPRRPRPRAALPPSAPAMRGRRRGRPGAARAPPAHLQGI
jgi:hypothetical protein